MCLEGLRAFACLLQNFNLHDHGAAGTAGDGVGLGLDFAVDILKAIHHALDGVLFTAGRPPIYGRQILHFQDPVFLERAKKGSANSGKEKGSAAASFQSAEELVANEYLRYLEDLPERIAR